MKCVRKLISAVLAAVTVVSMLLMTACSTPAVALTVNGKEYATGEYLANLYLNFKTAYYDGGLYQYAQYGMDPWAQSLNYGEGDNAISLKMGDYIVQMTKDNIVRQQAVVNLMEKHGVKADEKMMKDFLDGLATQKESDLLFFGFNKEHYQAAYIESQINERSLFYGLYDEGGKRAVSKEDIRAFFDKSYVAYKAITVSMTDSEGKDYADAEKQKTKDMLGEYLEQYKKSGDFDAVIEQYEKDTSEKEEEEKKDSETDDKKDEAVDPTVKETVDNKDEDTDEADKDAEQEEKEEKSYVQFLNSVSGDKAVVEAVMGVPENQAKVIEYKTTGGKLTAALVLRLNVEKEGNLSLAKAEEDAKDEDKADDNAEKKDYYELQHDNCLYGLKFEEFDKEVKEAAAALTPVYNDAAIKACDPKNFDPTAK